MAHPLLHRIDEIVAADGGPAGFSGTVCIGVGRPGAIAWWRGSFGRPVAHGLVAELDTDADAVLALSEETAAEIVRAGVGDTTPSYVLGDTELLARFIRRYMCDQSLVALRAHQGSQP